LFCSSADWIQQESLAMQKMVATICGHE
jgi:hypothetical protein